MIKSLSLVAAMLCLSACVVPNNAVVYEPPVVNGNPVLVYPAEPLVGETVIIEGRPYYRHYHNGAPYYHHSRHF